MRTTMLQGLLVLALVLAGAALLVATGVQPLRDDLDTEPLETGEAREAALAFLADGRRLATASAELLDTDADGIHLLRVSVEHADDVLLDALRLELDPGESDAEIALRTPAGLPWPPISFHRVRDESSVVVTVPELEAQGEGTVTLEFVLGPTASVPSVEILVDVTLDPMGPLAFSRYEGSGSLAMGPATDGVVVTFLVGDREEFRVLLTDPREIRVARQLLAGERQPLIPTGRVIRGETGVNEGWSWRIDPQTFEWAEVTIEVCDGLPSMVEAGTITSERYCPWSAEVIGVEPAG